VYPANLLAALKTARHIGDWNLYRAIAGAKKFGDEFPVKVESIGVEAQAGDRRSTEHFVHREWVFQSTSVHDIEQKSEHPVRRIDDGKPKSLIVRSTHRLSGLVARAEHESDGWVIERCQQLRVVGHGVLAVGIVDEHDVAGCDRESGAHCISLAARRVLPNNLHTGPFCKLPHYLS